MCDGFECMDCPAITTENCYYYGHGFMDYYEKVQWEQNNILLNNIL